MTFLQFVGAPRGHHGPYTFYKGFSFFKHGNHKVILLGQFFFVRISTKDDPCIGELQLLWDDRHNNQRLSSVRLYFLPEQTPDGRLPHHGEDEVLAASDKVVLKLDDLVSWITDEVEWTHGLVAPCSDDVISPPEPSPPTTVLPEEENHHPAEANDSLPEENQKTLSNECEDILPSENCPPEEISRRNKEDSSVAILSFPRYCRLKAIVKRLEGVPKNWHWNALVIALGGFTPSGRHTQILFCRDSFDHEDLAHHDLNYEHLAPNLKKSRKKKQSKTTRSVSPGSESNTSEECRDSAHKASLNDLTNGVKQLPCRNEQEFLQRLFEFMKKRNTPIQRVPHLGFKQIDLFIFFTFSQKLGGYDKITGKKLWKHVYDELGGNPGSTSAATCTRRHYERLLLPFERFLNGKVCKPLLNVDVLKPREKRKFSKNENFTDVCEEVPKIDGLSPGVEDAFTFTDSNLENSKDSISTTGANLDCEEKIILDNYSEGESKTSWNIQKQPDSGDKMNSNYSRKEVQPIVIQKVRGESFSEKERKWNEIRRKNALARRWVRQLRPSRTSKAIGIKSCPESLDYPQRDSLFHTEVESSVEERDLVQPIVSSFTSNCDKNAASDSSLISDVSETLRSDYPHLIQTMSVGDPSARKHISNKIAISSENHRRNYNCFSKVFPLYSKLHSFSAESKHRNIGTNAMYGYLKDSMPYQKMSSTVHGKCPPDHLLDLISSHINVSGKAKELSMNGYHSDSSVLQNSGHVSISTTKAEAQPDGGLTAMSQRRPSVIQHTELIVSPSTSQSPVEISSENTSSNFLKTDSQIFLSIGDSQKTNIFSNNLSHSIADKVAEWMTKVVPEAIACKTPIIDNKSDCNDQILATPCSKMQSEECNKILLHSSNKKEIEIHSTEIKEYAQSSKVNRNEISYKTFAHLPANGVQSCSSWNNTGECFPSNINKMNLIGRSGTKTRAHDNFLPQQSICAPRVPYFRHPKRNKTSAAPLSSPINNQLLSFHQTYRTSHIDVPNTESPLQCEYECSVLDLSTKSKSHQLEELSKPCQVKLPTPATYLNGDEVCLDLSIKKRSTNSSNNGIENIIPPLPSSPSILLSHTTLPFNPPSSPFSLIDSAVVDPLQQKQYESCRKISTVNKFPQEQLPKTLSSVFDSSCVSSLSNNIYQRIHPVLINSSEMTSSKDASNIISNSAELHSHFSPCVIPPFYSSKWTSSISSTPNSFSNSQTSPNNGREILKHSVFSKYHPYKTQSQFYPLLCKDKSIISKSK